jgi:hypothetical protein
MPNYDSLESAPDSPRILIAFDFFKNPPDNVVIEWPDGWTADTLLDSDGAVIHGGYCQRVRDHKPCHEHCMKGVVVKLVAPRRVWVLTGRAETRTSAGMIHLLGYEAVWPD